MTAMVKVETEIRARGESLTAFAARIGVRSQDLNNWKKRGIPRSRQKLVADALGWTLDHLLADDDTHSITPPSAPKNMSQLAIAEPMIGYPAPSTPPSTTARVQHPFDLPTDRYTLIPRRKIGLSQESGALVLEAETPPLVLDTEWLRRSGLRAEHAAVLYMQEDSMEPSIRQGDVLLVDLGEQKIQDGGIFAIRYAHELRVRRLYRRYDGGLILRSENRGRYPDETIPPADQDVHVQVIGRVLWRGGTI
ncbi:MAG: helix-turn-helix transcriptional regulator [Lamprocystis purpurea]|uniref:S24 family peptidase n=1 Tax=Lamprocystis purpurea TaxID=61598 RepID=UPI00037EAC7C|nr:S24 family peptidase [Lamprocystis purpurea]MBV5272213.1 helix-turn-helix transcriptional regulator [Lamprocystis purpurea]